MSVRKRKWTTARGEVKEAWVADYADRKGGRHIRTFRRKKEAQSWLEDERPAIKAGRHVAGRDSKTLAEAADIWVDAVKVGRGDRPPAEASTIRQYTYHRDTYIVPALGETKLTDLTKTDVIAFRDRLLSTISRPLAKKVLTSLKGILSEADDRDLVGANVAEKVKIGNASRGRTEVIIPEVAEVRAILEKLDEFSGQEDPRSAKAWRRWRVVLATAIHTGMRASEVRGLPWANVDFAAGKILVKQRADENGEVGPTKSEAGTRTISIPRELVHLLKAWKLECPKSDRDLVFPNGAGNPESLANIFNRAWSPVQTAAGICDPKLGPSGKVERDEEGRPIMRPRHNFHSLRHFHASMLIADGANPKDIQVEMGHSSIQITFDLYGHLFRDEAADKRGRERSERMAGLLG